LNILFKCSAHPRKNVEFIC